MNTATRTQAMAYRPKPGTLPARVIAWLQDNPTEELTREDIGAKWDAYPSTVSLGLEKAVNAGALRLARNSEGQEVYRLPIAPTPNALAQASPFNGTAAELATPAARTASTANRNLTAPKRGAVAIPASVLDFSGLKAEVGVPLLGKTKSEPGVSKWQPLIDLLPMPDMSVEFPAEWKSAVAAQTTKLNVAAKKAGKPTHYKVRLVSQDKARIWRVA